MRNRQPPPPQQQQQQQQQGYSRAAEVGNAAAVAPPPRRAPFGPPIGGDRPSGPVNNIVEDGSAGDDGTGTSRGPASWQEGFGSGNANDGGQQQQSAAAAAPSSSSLSSSSFARNDFDADRFYGEEGEDEQGAGAGVGALSALLLGGAASRNTARSGRGAEQNQPSRQQPSSTRSESQSAPADKGSTQLSRSDLMRLICGNIGTGTKKESSASSASSSSKRRKVEHGPDSNANPSGTSTSVSGSNGGLFSVSLPSDSSDSDSD